MEAATLLQDAASCALEGFALAPQQRIAWAGVHGHEHAPRCHAIAATIGDGVSLAPLLCQRLQRLVSRHEVLRTASRRHPELSEPLQVVLEPDAELVRVQRLDWSTLPPSQLPECQQALWQQMLARPVDAGLSVALATLPGNSLHVVLALAPLAADQHTLLEVLAAALDPRESASEPTQYLDIAAWLQELGEADAAAAGRRFWQQAAQAAGGAIALDTQARVDVPTELDVTCCELAQSSLVQLRARAQAQQIEVADLCFASWVFLLQMLSTDERLPPIALCSTGRSDASLSGSLGLLERQLSWNCADAPVSADRAGLLRIAASARRMHELQDFQPARRTAVAPYAFQYLVQPRSNARIVGLRCVNDRFRVRGSVLVPEAVGEGDTATLRLEYPAGVLPQRAAQLMLEQWSCLLEDMASAPAEGPYRLQLSVTLQQRLLALCHGELHPLAETDNVIAWLQATTGGGAIISDGHSHSLDAVQARSNRCARLLRQRGIGRGDIVGLYLPRSVDYVVAMLAVLQTGAAYLPLDVDYPAERLDYMLGNAAPALVIAAGAVTLQRSVTLMPELEAAAASLSAAPLELDIRGTDAAYVLYTSGSTGAPKGVVIAHRALFNHMRWMLTQFDFTAEDVFLQRTSSSFDASVWEFWAPLLVRGQMIIARQERLYDLDYLIRLIAQHAVSVAQFVPSLLELLLEYSEFCAAPALRWTFAGGEALTAALRRKYFERMRARLCNLYGPTEACIDATFRVCSAADVASTTIGRPIHNTAVTVMNAGELAGIGVAGEICISGAGLFTGYLHAPDLTAQRVFTPRCAPQPHYRTGDLGRLREDGDIEYLGRIDQQVKLHGYRIELSEIDAVLEQQPGVRRAVTVVSSNLLASVVQVDTAQYAADAVLDGARRRLPHYMVPSSLLSIEVLPTLPNGKLDRARLVALVAEQQRAAECAEPENEVQRALLAIWRKVLKQERIGVRDRFFAVGGDSIRSIQVVYEAARAGFEFSVMDLFKHQTISALAQSLQSQPVVRNAAPELENPAPAALRQQFEDAYPATQMQRYMIEAYAADTARHGVFHAQQSLRVVLPAYDVTALARAVAEAADVPTFRTRFVAAQDELYQVLVQRRIAAQIIDLRGASARQQQQRIAELISTDRSSAFDPFDVEAALLRVYLMLLDADSFELCITNHHAIQDGWGHIELLNRICNAYLQPHSAPVSGGNLNSANVNKEFALRQHALLQDAAQVQFWQTQAGQLAVHSVLRATSYRRESQVLSAELMAALEALGRRDNLSHKALFLGAYLATLQQAGLGSVAQAVGVVSNGRSQELSDPLGAIGLFWNLLPFAAEPVTTQLASCCARIQERLIALEPYARFPLRCIEQQAGGRVFAATFNFVNFHNQQRSATARLAAIRGTHALDNFGFPLGLTVGLDAQGSASFLLQLDDSIALSARELCTTFVGQLELLARTATTVTQ